MRLPSRVVLAAAAALCASLLLSPPSASQSPAPPSHSAAISKLSPQVQRAIDKLVASIQKLGGSVAVSVVEVESGAVLAAHAEREPMNPASNMKVLTAAAAMAQLTPTYRFRTALFGKRNGGVVDELTIRGSGDPSLTSADLYDMVAELKRAGIRKVQGDVVVDQTQFDDAYLPPGFEQQPNEWAYFRAPVSALALNRNAVTVSVYPTARDQQAVVAFDPPGVVDTSGMVKTGDPGTAQNVALQLVPNGYRLSAKLGGAIPQDGPPLVFPRRIDNPTLFAGFALKAILLEQGIAVGGNVRPGVDRSRAVLAVHKSRPLSELLYELGKFSDNFYAETIFKSLAGKDKSRGLSSADGAEAVLRHLRGIGAADEGMVIKNGSGLFDTNRVTANSITRTLRAAYLDASYSSEYVAHFAIGGVDGTLHDRFRALRKQRVLRAKTGTLSDVTALSGYVLAPPGRPPIAFSVIVNKIPGKVVGSRAAVDKCVTSIVHAVWKNKGPIAGRDDDE